jgi:serine phosphatase RsbU (regulator of sigma subunit)
VKLSRTFRISGALTAVGIVLLVLIGKSGSHGFLSAVGILLVSLAGPVFAVSAARHLIRGLLWRVGSRLLVSYFLIGVLPIPFVLAFLFGGALVFCGQIAGRRVEAALEGEARALAAADRELAAAPAGTLEERFATLRKAHAADLPGLEYLNVPASGAPESSAGVSAGKALAPKIGSSPLLLARWKEAVYLVAAAPVRGEQMLLGLPFGQGLAGRLQSMTGVTVGFSTAISTPKRAGSKPARPRKEGPSGAFITTGDENVRFETLGSNSSSSAPAPARLVDREWVHWIYAVDAPIRDWESGEPVPGGRLALTLRSSVAREMHALFGDTRIGNEPGSETGTVVLQVMKAMALFTLAIYACALLIAGFLVLRIARATGRLSRGFAEIDRGNFAARVSLRGRDQLAELVESFNEMASHLQESVSEKASHAALEKELDAARTLQRNLLPPPDFSFPGLQIAVDFVPAQAIGGDFYHFLPEGPDRLTVVVADVSGHGLSTGIVMASAKASLSALALASRDAIAVLGSLDEEVRRTTDSRTFVTLAHVRFLFDEESVEFTNAGHPYPYRVDPLGAVSSLANPARPLGVRLPGTFRTVRAPLVAGDLWVLYSDGIVEALSPAGEIFGFPRLESLVARSAGCSAAETRDRILSAWREFAGGDSPSDDRTLLVLKVLRRDEE